NIRQAGRRNGLSEAQINQLVASTNVYPPNQITNTFEDAEDAASFFRANGHPRLDNAPTDGIFSAGGPAFRQAKEVTNGRLFRFNPSTNTAVKTSTDLSLATEGYERFFTAGEAGSAQHWADEVLGDLGRNDLRALRKHAERLRTSLNKARNLERVGMRADFLDDIVNGRVTDSAAVRGAIGRARQDADLLTALSRQTSARTRSMIVGFLNEDLGRWARMRRAFWNLAGKVPVNRLVQAFMVYSAYARTMALADTIDPREFNAAVLRGAGTELAWLAGPAIGIAAEIADAVLMSAREGAFQIVTAFQDCTDLAGGVVSVKGREDLVPGLRMDQLARRLADTPGDRERLDTFIRTQAYQASFRFEKNGWVSDPNIQRTLYDRCATVIVSKWLDARIDLIDAFNATFADWAKTMYADQATLTLNPDVDEIVLTPRAGGPAQERVRVIGRMLQPAGRIDGSMEAMNARLVILEGESRRTPLTLNREFRLSVNGRLLKTTSDPDQVMADIVVDQPGDYTVTLEHEYSMTAIFLSDDIQQNTPFITQDVSGLVKRYVKRATVSFSAVAVRPPTAPPPEPAPTTTGPPVKTEPPSGSRPPAGGSTAKPVRTAEDILAEYRALYPAYVQRQYPGATIEMRANATGSGDKYTCSYIAWGIIQDGPRKGERAKLGDFTRDFTLSALDALIPPMKKALGR
ncbi:MAG: hypothetical protein NTY02_18280, partial [Acidobacteria bacterium]|nr:hypothetical protein [Acidobacteriota bacterium]